MILFESLSLTGEGRAFGAGADLSEDDGQGGLMMGERTRDALINEFGPGSIGDCRRAQGLGGRR